jgi:hypothetical protein
VVNSLHPGYIQIDYHSAFGVHKAILPTRAPTFSVIGDEPEYESWDSGTILASDMVEALVDLFAAFFDNTIIWDTFTVYNVPSVGAAAQPIFTAALAKTGAGTQTGTSKATQRTYSMRTTGFGLAKLVFLDTKTANSFEKSLVVSSGENAFLAAYMNPIYAWSGRDGNRPAVFKSLTITLNEKLRREYKMT